MINRRHNTRAMIAIASIVALVFVVSTTLVMASNGADVEVINDNNNVDGGTPNPGFDAQNRQSNETSVAISPVDPNIVVVGANDYRMLTVHGDAWLGFYVSTDNGATWFNTFVPGFTTDASAAGLASPLLGLDGSGDPVVRFGPNGDLYIAGIAFNRNFDQPDRPVDNVVYVARYAYTPGTPAGVSTPSSAANPPNFTYTATSVVDRGAVGFALPGLRPGAAGEFVDKEWMEVDTYAGSPCQGNVYVSYTAFHGVAGNFPIKLGVSADGGVTFSTPRTVSSGGKSGTPANQGSDIAVGPDGAVYVAYRTYPDGSNPSSGIAVVKSTDCGQHWSRPVTVANIVAAQAPGVAFRTPTFAYVAVDDTNPSLVYVAYQNLVDGDYDIYVQRSTDGGYTWGSASRVNEDGANRHQVFPTIDAIDDVLHVAWYDFRHSATDANEGLDVYYAYTKSSMYPSFSPNMRVTDVSHDGNCLMFGGGTVAFHGDYIELDAVDGPDSTQVVHVAWTDNRDVSPCDLDPAPGPASNNTGNRNQNVYSDRISVTP